MKRHVLIDLGYGPSEHWVRAKVVKNRMLKGLFDEGESEQLLVEVPGGERIWVSYWKKVG